MNECEDCDRLDCRQHGCIAPVGNWSAPFAPWVVEGWEQMSKANGWDKTAEQVRSNIIKASKIGYTTMKQEDTEEAYLRTIIRELLAVMPVFPEGAKAIIGLEDKYNMAVRMAREAVRYKR